MIDHASRLRAQQSKAANRAALEEIERRSAPLLWAIGLIALAAALGLSSYKAGLEVGFGEGYTRALRECPPAQHGERLLSSEQRADGVVCRYAASGTEYGRKLASRRAKS